MISLIVKEKLTLSLIILLGLLPSILTSSDLDETIQCTKQYIQTLSSEMRTQLFRIFANSFPNTLQTTIQHFNLTQGYEFTYIITGDIEAMWLRDSTNQWLPYLAMNKTCPHIKTLTKGLINAQAQFIMTDPYTNAFKRYEKNMKARPFYLNDKTEKHILGVPVDLCRHRDFATRSIWERKWEIDSLASFLRLSYEYYRKYNDISMVNMDLIRALKRILTTLDEQVKDEQYQKTNNLTYYTFYRDARELAGGKIKPSGYTGMIKTGFRPSDDPNELPFNIPGNAMMVSFLQLVSTEVFGDLLKDSVYYNYVQSLVKRMQMHAQNIMKGIRNYGIVERSAIDGGSVYAYEVDGFGKFRLYDDANLPSLLSLPYLGFVKADDPIYVNTRALVLSKNNPFYFKNGRFGGEGSSHTPRDTIWPLALMVQALTSQSEQEIRDCLFSLEKSAVQDLMHESFSVHNPEIITREWFAWANSFFGETVLTLMKTRPDLLK